MSRTDVGIPAHAFAKAHGGECHATNKHHRGGAIGKGTTFKHGGHVHPEHTHFAHGHEAHGEDGFNHGGHVNKHGHHKHHHHKGPHHHLKHGGHVGNPLSAENPLGKGR